MLTKNHAKLTFEVRKHLEEDRVVQQNYWKNGKGCFIGCLAHSSNATLLEKRYGLPLPVVYFCNSIFKRLPLEEAKQFFAAIPGAVGRDGKDLTRVLWKFLATGLRLLPPQPIEVQAVIDPVIAGMDLLASGKKWPGALDAANTAYDVTAAFYAALAPNAADTPYVGTYATYAVFHVPVTKQRDKILALIKGA